MEIVRTHCNMQWPHAECVSACSLTFPVAVCMRCAEGNCLRFPANSTCDLGCNDGYTLVGNSYTCTNKTLYSTQGAIGGGNQSCVAVPCYNQTLDGGTLLPALWNSQPAPLYTNVTLVCATGYVGGGKQQCLPYGPDESRLLPEDVTCVSLACDADDLLAMLGDNVDLGSCPTSGHSQPNGTSCTIGCAAGSTTIDPPELFTFACLGGGWIVVNDTMPSCVLQCQPPDLTDYPALLPGTCTTVMDGHDGSPTCTLDLAPGWQLDQGSLDIGCSNGVWDDFPTVLAYFDLGNLPVEMVRSALACTLSASRP